MNRYSRVHRYLVVYDLSSDQERYRLDKLLKGWGSRIQKSVFTVTTSRTGLARLESELGRLALASGSVVICRLQAGAALKTYGQALRDPDEEIAYVY